MEHADVFVLGSFAADVAFRADRLPVWGETLMGSAFALGPGGKGSNQAVAAARAGATVVLQTAIGQDAFGELGRRLWTAEGIGADFVKTANVPTGSAAILINEGTGDNAIIIVPGACSTLSPADVEAASLSIQGAKVFLTQLEIPLPAVQCGLELARRAGATTILNPAPAPANPLPRDLLSLVDYLVANETEATQLSGMPISTPDQAHAAARYLLGTGATHLILTLGERGSLFCAAQEAPVAIPAICPGPVLDTTGAGDAFVGAFAASLSCGTEPIKAAQFASAAAGLSVTRHGTALSMPHRRMIEALLQGSADGHLPF